MRFTQNIFTKRFLWPPPPAASRRRKLKKKKGTYRYSIFQDSPPGSLLHLAHGQPSRISAPPRLHGQPSRTSAPPQFQVKLTFLTVCYNTPVSWSLNLQGGWVLCDCQDLYLKNHRPIPYILSQLILGYFRQHRETSGSQRVKRTETADHLPVILNHTWFGVVWNDISVIKNMLKLIYRCP